MTPFGEYVEIGNNGGGKEIRKFLLIFLIAITIVSAIVAAEHYGLIIRWSVVPFGVTTLNATNIGTNQVTFNGDLTLNTSSAIVWFEYGIANSSYPYKTNNLTMTTPGNFNRTITGIPLFPNVNYQYRAVATVGSLILRGNVKTFKTLDVSNLEDWNFSQNYKDWKSSNFNLTTLSIIIPKTYTNMMGDIFWGLLFGSIFLAMWIRQEDISIPSILGILIGGTFLFLLPPEWVKVSYSLLIVSIAGLMYTIIKGRR